MDVIDNTPNYGLPMPHPNNPLENDVMRLRTMLTSVDYLLQAMQEGIDMRATQSDMLIAESQLNDLNTAVTELLTGKVSSVNGVFGENINLAPENLLLGPANGPSSRTATYDSQGRIITMTIMINGKTSINAIGYDSAGRIGQVQTIYNGRNRTEVLTYGVGGRIVSTEASEVQA